MGPRERVAATLSWRWVRGAGTLLIVVAAVEYGVVPFVVHARTQLSVLDHVAWPLLLLAVVLEVASLAAYTGLTQVLMGPADRLGFGTQWRIDLVGYGMSHALPGGGATAGGLRAKLMTDRGVEASVAMALTVLQLVLSMLGLLAVWSLGAMMSVPRSGLTATTVLLLVAATAAVGALGVAPRLHRRRRRRRSGSAGRRLSGVVPQRWRAVLSSATGRGAQSLQNTHVTRQGVTWAAANWLLDAVCLWTCLRAFGASVPIELVLASYGVVNAIAVLPLTPGGIGVVEGLLIPALVAAGASAGAAMFGVLTWRLLQFWLPMPVAGLCWASLGVSRSAGRARSGAVAMPGGPTDPQPGCGR